MHLTVWETPFARIRYLNLSDIRLLGRKLVLYFDELLPTGSPGDLEVGGIKIPNVTPLEIVPNSRSWAVTLDSPIASLRISDESFYNLDGIVKDGDASSFLIEDSLWIEELRRLPLFEVHHSSPIHLVVFAVDDVIEAIVDRLPEIREVESA